MDAGVAVQGHGEGGGDGVHGWWVWAGGWRGEEEGVVGAWRWGLHTYHLVRG